MSFPLRAARETWRPTAPFNLKSLSQFQRLASLLLAVLISAAVLLPLLGHKVLADWDEGIYAEVSREFLGRGWLIPYWHFRPWFEKPPLALWITAGFFRPFGANEFWARFGSAFASIGIIAFVHTIARHLRGLLAAWLTTLILLTTFGFLRVARMGELDALLTLGCIVALFGLAKIREGEQRGWYWFWTGFAIAVMTKGAAAVTLPLTLIVLFIWNRWGWRQLGQAFWGGTAVFALLVLPWHFYMLHTFGSEFLREYLGLHVITRATTQMEGHQTPWWFYARVLLIYTSPYLLLYPFALWWQVRRRELREYLVFALVVLVFFTAVATRSPKYIFPAYPALALLTGDWLSAHLERHSRKFFCAVGFVAVAAFVATVGIKKSPLGQSLTTTRTAAGTILYADREPETLLLAALRSPQASGLSDPILLWQEDTVAQLPSILFYVRRPLQQVYLVRYPDTLSEARRYADPEPLRNFVGTTPRLILLEPSLAAEIPGDLQFTPIAVGKTLEAGIILLSKKK